MMKTTARKVSALLAALVLPAWMSAGAAADDQSWPTKISFEQGSMLIYQPQIESLEGNSIEARAAISIRKGPPESTPTFAAIRFIAATDSPQGAPVLTARDIELVDLHLSEEDSVQREELIEVVMQQLAGITLAIAIEHRVTESGAEGPEGPSGLRSDPPRIILSMEPAMLARIDGEPHLQSIEGTDLEWVVNSAIPIIKQEQMFYLFGGALWYSSERVLGPWGVSEQVPDEVRQVVEEEPDQDAEAIDPVPVKIIVALGPTELIVSDGDPSWSPVVGMELLFMSNTDSNVFLELATGHHFLLLGGRWFRGSLRQSNANWQPVPNDALPAAFADIVEDSRRGEVLTHVAGTSQAQDAVLENSLPETAAVKRGGTSFEADWDGEPQFETVQILGQHDEVLYAINTVDSVFKVGDTYYACEEGVWYESRSAFGPWTVATYIPSAIYAIPPSNPHHRVTHVRIYDVTPDVVYVGYTPGYLGSYTYHGSVVYGTGYRYDPWYGSYYYPRRLTWGMNPYYDPWFGWSSGIVSLHRPFRYNFRHSSHRHRHLSSPARFDREKRKRRSDRHAQRTDRRRQRDAYNPARLGNQRRADRSERHPDRSERHADRSERHADRSERTDRRARHGDRSDHIARRGRDESDQRIDRQGKKRQRSNRQRPAAVDAQSARPESTPRVQRRASIETVVDTDERARQRIPRSHSGNPATAVPSDFAPREGRPNAARPIRRAQQRRLAVDVPGDSSGGETRARSAGVRELRGPPRDRQISGIKRPAADSIRSRPADAVRNRSPRKIQSSPARVVSKPVRTAAVKKSTRKPAEESARSERQRSDSKPTHERRQGPRRGPNAARRNHR